MKSILAIFLTLFVATAVAAAPVPAADQAAIRTFLTRLYSTYRSNDLDHTWGKTIGAKNVFTPSTLKLWDDNTRLLAKRGDGVGAIGADIFCACQDFGAIPLIATVLTPLPSGRVNAVVTFNNAGKRTLRIQFERTPAGWRVYDVELPQQGMLRAVLAKENAELSKGASAATQPAPPTVMPAEISYAGPSRYKTYETVQDMELKIAGSTISGVIASQFFGRLVAVPVAGTYANGTCSVQLKSDTFSGPCDAHGFSGNRLSRKGEIVGSFAFKNVDELPAGQASTGAPSPITPTATEAAYPERQAAQMELVPSYGRSRLLVEPSGGCSQAGELVRGYCFDFVIAYLRSRPQQQDVTVLTMTRSYLLGTWVPLNSGQGWNVYEVKRRGDGFYADRDRQFSTVVNPPSGCRPATMQDEGWLVTTSGGYKVAAEAKHYLCDPSQSTGPITAQGPHSLPGGGSRQSNGRSGYSYQPRATPTTSSNSQASTDFGSPAAFRQDDSGIITGGPDDATPAATRPHHKKHPHD